MVRAVRPWLVALTLAVATVTLYATTNQDDFNRSNNELEAGSTTWTKLRTGGQTVNIVSNQLQGVGTTDAPYRYDADYASAALYSCIELATGATGAEFAVIVNVGEDQDGDRDYNIFEFTESAGSYNALIGKIVNGAFTSLDTTTGLTINNGEKVCGENDGSGVLTASIEDTPIAGLTATDTDNNSLFGVGIMPSSNGSERLDNFDGGDLGGGGGGGSAQDRGLQLLGVSGN